MEGVNMGGLLLLFLALIVLGATSLVAFVLFIARLHRVAVLVFAAGFLSASLIAALATLSFLDSQFQHDASTAMILLTVLTLVLAGTGQFIAILRSPRVHAAASFGCAAASVAFLTIAGAGGDAMPFQLPGAFAASLILAAASMMIGVLPPGRKPVALLVIAILGAIAGFGAGYSAVGTRCTVLGPEGRATPVKVEVHVLGMLVSEETGMAPIPEEGPAAIRTLSMTQVAWVYGLPVGCAVAGLISALGIATFLVKPSGERVPDEALASLNRGPSSDQIRPA